MAHSRIAGGTPIIDEIAVNAYRALVAYVENPK